MHPLYNDTEIKLRENLFEAWEKIILNLLFS
jgi:hypothetical protein